MLDLSAVERNEVQAILARHAPGVEVRAFGSRVLGKSHRHSDLDLAVVSDESLSLRFLGDLQEAFQESNLLFRVDLVDWRSLSPAFRATIEPDCVTLQPRKG